MNLTVLAGVVAGVYLTTYFATPFPYWPTYWKLWRTVLFAEAPAITRRARFRQAALLGRHALLYPLWTVLWYLDEIFFPSYRSREIRPVFVVGQPRSGSTLMHRTLASDQNTFFAVRHIEWRLPFISVQKLLRLFALSETFKKINYWPDTEAGRLASRMHPNSLADWEEEGIFFEERIAHHFFLFLRFPYPELLPAVDEFDRLPPHARRRILAVHRKVLQKVMYLRGKHDTYYLSKEVTSHDKIPHLLALYPEAKVLVVLRHSRFFMSSLLELVRNSTKVKTGIDPLAIPHWHAAFVRRMREDSLRLVELCTGVIPSHQQLRVASDRFTADIPGTVHDIYRRFGLALGPEFETRLKALQEKQAGRDRGYSYTDAQLAGFERYDQFVTENTSCGPAAAVPWSLSVDRIDRGACASASVA